MIVLLIEDGLEYNTRVEFNNVSLPLLNVWESQKDIWEDWEEIK